LDAVREKSVVAIHDGVRPFASVSLIRRCFAEAEKHGNAIPCMPVKESLRKITPGKNEMVERNSFVVVQTPQCFDSEILKEAYRTAYQPGFTDDAAVVEHYSQSIHLVEGESENIKITFPVDLIIGEEILKSRAADSKL
jgi:2-C-methyl-D-erythritol 4-phosphate cytidylyltransferase